MAYSQQSTENPLGTRGSPSPNLASFFQPRADSEAQPRPSMNPVVARGLGYARYCIDQSQSVKRLGACPAPLVALRPDSYTNLGAEIQNILDEGNLVPIDRRAVPVLLPQGPGLINPGTGDSNAPVVPVPGGVTVPLNPTSPSCSDLNSCDAPRQPIINPGMPGNTNQPIVPVSSVPVPPVPTPSGPVITLPAPAPPVGITLVTGGPANNAAAATTGATVDWAGEITTWLGEATIVPSITNYWLVLGAGAILLFLHGKGRR